jgi:uncharacterized protein DUF6867
MDLIADNALAFLLITVVLGGGAAWLAGRAIALTWRPWWHGIGYMLILGGAVRFMHFALADGTLLSPVGYLIDTAVTIAFASAGFFVMRRHQKRTEYGFLYGFAPPSRQQS